MIEVRMAHIGIMYHYGEGCEKNDQKAFELFEKSAKQGNIAAQYDVGLYYDFGYGVKQDYEKAIEWYEKAAKECAKKYHVSYGNSRL